MRFTIHLVAAFASLAPAQTLSDCVVKTIAGRASTDGGDGGLAIQAQLHQPGGLTADSAGNVYIADSANQKIRKISPNGIITTFAGTGVTGWSGDGGPATSARLWTPRSPAIGPDGSVYFVDSGNYRVRRIMPDGTITTVAGSGLKGFEGDGGPATDASIFPFAVGVDSNGDLFIADVDSRVRRVDSATGLITTYAGIGPRAGGSFARTDLTADGAAANSVQLLTTTAIALDGKGNLFIATGDAIVKVTSDGIFHSVAGPRNGDRTPPTEGRSALSTTINVATIAADPDGAVYFSGYTSGYSGIWSFREDGILHAVSMNSVGYLAYTSAGLIACDYSSSAYQVTSNGLQLLAGVRPMSPVNVSRDIGVDVLGNLYILDDRTRIRKVAADGSISTVAGSGRPATGGDGGAATAASFYATAFAVDGAGNLFIGDFFAGQVRKVDTAGTIKAYTGPTSPAAGAGGQPGITTGINAASLAVDSQGNLYILDLVTVTLWKVTVDGIAHALIRGHELFSPVIGPRIVCDPNDNLYLAAAGHVYRVSQNGTLEDWKRAYSPIAVDGQGLLYGASSESGLPLLKFLTNGTIATYLPAAGPGLSATDGPALASLNAAVLGISLDRAGNLYFADPSWNRVRMIPAACQPEISP